MQMYIFYKVHILCIMSDEQQCFTNLSKKWLSLPKACTERNGSQFHPMSYISMSVNVFQTSFYVMQR